MKLSLVLSTIILAVGLVIGFIYQNKLRELRSDRDQLVARAVTLGITTGPRLAKRERDERETRTRSAAADIGAFARHLQIQMESDGFDAPFQQRATEMLDRMMALEPDELSAIIASLRDDKALGEDTLRQLVGFAILILAEKDPATALALAAQSNGPGEESEFGHHVVAAALRNRARDDPRAALDWIRENAGKHPELTDDAAKCSVLSGAASSDPALAFTLIAELDVEEISEAIHAIVETGKTHLERAAILDAFRGYLAGVTDESDRDELREEALGGLARNLSAEGFDSLTVWLASQKLDPAELSEFSGGLSYETTGRETGRWIDWMAEKVPADKRGERIGDLMGQWTQEDYVAAGEWLAAAPEEPGKTAAVKAYAETVAEYEPQIAAQWALMLADPEERAETLKRIYLNLPRAEAAAFAAQHGVETD